MSGFCGKRLRIAQCDFGKAEHTRYNTGCRALCVSRCLIGRSRSQIPNKVSVVQLHDSALRLGLESEGRLALHQVHGHKYMRRQQLCRRGSRHQSTAIMRAQIQGAAHTCCAIFTPTTPSTGRGLARDIRVSGSKNRFKILAGFGKAIMKRTGNL